LFFFGLRETLWVSRLYQGKLNGDNELYQFLCLTHADWKLLLAFYLYKLLLAFTKTIDFPLGFPPLGFRSVGYNGIFGLNFALEKPKGFVFPMFETTANF